MSKARDWDMLTADIAEHGCPPPKTTPEIDALVKDSVEVEKFSKQLAAAIKDGTALNRVRLSSQPRPVSSLLSLTSWAMSTTKAPLLKRLSAVVLAETESGVLEAREKSLTSRHTMDLRFTLWLETNIGLARDSPGYFGVTPSFSWWDLCKDQIPETDRTVMQPYEADVMIKKVSRLVFEDEEAVKELGDFLTRCKALVNNRDASPDARVISSAAKKMIDRLLEVSRRAK